MNAVTASVPACDNSYRELGFTITAVMRATAQWCDANGPDPSPAGRSPKTQHLPVGVALSGIYPPAHYELSAVQVSASAQTLSGYTTQLNETALAGWQPRAVNDASMDDAKKQTAGRMPEYLPADIPRPHAPVPLQEQIAPPEPEWARQGPRKPNVLTDAQKKHIYRKMPQGWEPLADAEIWALTPEKLHNITGAHITTCRRWMKHPPPQLVVRLVCIVIGGDLGAINEEWRGWRLRACGDLVSPEEWYFTVGRVRLSYLQWSTNNLARSAAEARARMSENRAVALEKKLQLSTQADFIENRWVEPGEHTLSDVEVTNLEESYGRHRLQKEEGTIWSSAAMAARVQERPSIDDEEHERERRERFYFWRERERRNEATHTRSIR
jgi:hypothetical protein